MTAVHGDGFAPLEGHCRRGTRDIPRTSCASIDFAASTPDAHAALWHTILGVDLVGPVRSTMTCPLDDPHPVPARRPARSAHDRPQRRCLVQADGGRRASPPRRYPTEDSLVLEVDGVRHRIDGAPDGASVQALAPAG
ncbi:MAG: hypothetical protein WKF58_06900 [Ilumatobacteraceae bacterium]